MKRINLNDADLSAFRNDTTLNLFGMAQSETSAIYVDGSNIAVTDGEQCCINGDDVRFACEVADTLPNQFELCATSTSLADTIASRYGRIEWRTDCGLYVYNGKPLVYTFRYKVESMSPEYWQLISEGTPYKASKQEIVPNLLTKPSSAIYVDGKPVCWCMLHTTGSLGMLYTLPEYRRKGMALDVMVDLCRKVLAQGGKPFAYIVKGNVASQQLAALYNLEYIGDYSWMGIVKENK